MKEQTITSLCDNCSAVTNEENLTEVGGQYLCPDCLESQTVVCTCCDKRISRYENNGDNRIVLCRSCFEMYYTRCGNCGGAYRKR